MCTCDGEDVGGRVMGDRRESVRKVPERIAVRIALLSVPRPAG